MAMTIRTVTLHIDIKSTGFRGGSDVGLTLLPCLSLSLLDHSHQQANRLYCRPFRKSVSLGTRFFVIS